MIFTTLFRKFLKKKKGGGGKWFSTILVLLKCRLQILSILWNILRILFFNGFNECRSVEHLFSYQKPEGNNIKIIKELPNPWTVKREPPTLCRQRRSGYIFPGKKVLKRITWLSAIGMKVSFKFFNRIKVHAFRKKRKNNNGRNMA